MKKIYSIIIPVKNEEKNIQETIVELRKNLNRPHETIIVDDHSTDNTFAIVSKFEEVSVIKSPNRGQGITIMRGIECSKTNIVVAITGDLSDNPKDIETLVKLIEKGFDVACASRYAKGSQTIGSDKVKRILSIIVSKLCQVITGVPTTDVTNSFRAYRKKIFKSIEVKTNGYATSMDIVLQAHKLGFRIIEIPTVWRNRTRGSSKFLLRREWKHYATTLLRAVRKK